MTVQNKYSFLKKIKMGFWLLRTKMICTNARLIRFPIDLRGKKFIDFGINLTTGIGCRLEAFSNSAEKTMIFGKNIQINDYVHISSMKSVSIGNNVLIASRVYISDNSHGFYKGGEEHSDPNIPPSQRPYYCMPVSVRDNVWIGEGVVIMPGVSIGEGCIIGANSVVTKSIPSYTIAVGCPAKVIKSYNFECRKWEKILSE